MNLRSIRLLALLALLSASWSTVCLGGENWAQWRGPLYNGVSSAKNTPISWSKTEGIAWRLPLPGQSGSTPIVWGDRVFLTSVSGDDILLLCVSTDGKELWRQRLGDGGTARYRPGGEGDNASPSASTDGKHVWATTANGYMGCYTLDGKQVWKINLEDRYGKYDIAFGMSSTPVLDGDRLYLQLIHGEGNPETREAVVAALDKATGKEVWKQDRPSDGRAECEHSYASPMIYRYGGREFLLTHGADYVVAHSLKDGHELWRCGNLNPKGSYNPTLRFVASPAPGDGIIVVPSAKRGPVLALKPDLKGDVTFDDSALIWRRSKGTPDVPSPVIHDGLVYLYTESGIVVCINQKTGEEYYQKRTTGGVHRASPVLADGKMYLASRNGVVTVIKTGKEFEILSKNDLGETIASSPAVVDGRVYIRTFNALYAIGK